MNKLYEAFTLNDKYFPWDFYQIAREFIKDNILFLNYSGDFAYKLLENKYSPSVLKFIAGFYEKDKEALKNSGALFYSSLDEICDNSMNLITSRFAFFDLNSVSCKLKKGGHLIAEELGFETFNSILSVIGAGKLELSASNNLENKVDQLKEHGFKVVTRKQEYKKIKLSKAEFIEYFEKMKSAFPGIFSIPLHSEALPEGLIEMTEHRYIYTAKKTK